MNNKGKRVLSTGSGTRGRVPAMGGKSIDWTKQGPKSKTSTKTTRPKRAKQGSKKRRESKPRKSGIKRLARTPIKRLLEREAGEKKVARTDTKKAPSPVVPIEVPCPWSKEELGEIIEAACRFIGEAKERHGKAFGWEVGKHLYWEVYRGDDAYIEWKSPEKDDSLRDISRGSGVPYGTLYNYLRAYMTRLRLERAGFSSDLSMKHMKEIAEIGDVQTMVAVARWIKDNGVSSTHLHEILDTLKEHLAEGGSIADFVRKPAHKKTARRRRKRLRDRELLVPRLLGVTGTWLRRARMREDKRDELVLMLRKVRARISGAAP